METLNLPPADLRTRLSGDRREVYDLIRKKFVTLTPEEWVRQHFLHFLVHHRNVPVTLIGVEKRITYNGLMKRFDILVYGRNGKPSMIVECKGPGITLTQDVFHQVALYNMTMNVGFLAVTNGLEHYVCKMDYAERSYQFLMEIPDYGEMDLNSEVAK